MKQLLCTCSAPASSSNARGSRGVTHAMSSESLLLLPESRGEKPREGFARSWSDSALEANSVNHSQLPRGREVPGSRGHGGSVLILLGKHCSKLFCRALTKPLLFSLKSPWLSAPRTVHAAAWAVLLRVCTCRQRGVNSHVFWEETRG